MTRAATQGRTTAAPRTRSVKIPYQAADQTGGLQLPALSTAPEEIIMVDDDATTDMPEPDEPAEVQVDELGELNLQDQEPGERADPEISTEDMSLENDPETTLIGSIFLHLLSEHDAYAALAMDDDTAIAMHEELHLADCGHRVEDWRFRPQRALANSMQNIDTEHQAALDGAAEELAGTP